MWGLEQQGDSTPPCCNPVGVDDILNSITQGSSFLATAGLNAIAPLGQANMRLFAQ
jgi:hypothetical protein